MDDFNFKKVSFGSERRIGHEMTSNGEQYGSSVSSPSRKPSPRPSASSSDIFAKAAELARSLDAHNFEHDSSAVVGTSNANLSTMNTRDSISLSQSIAGELYSNRRPASPSLNAHNTSLIGQMKQYSYEYVSKMQRNHQDRLSEAMEASSRIIQTKEFEIGELSQKLQIAHEKLTSVNEDFGRQTAKLMAERDDVLRSAERQKREFEEILDLERHKYNSEMESMRKIQDQCQREKEEALRLLDRVKRECEDIIANEKRQCAHEIEMTKRSHESDMQNLHRRLEGEVKRLDSMVLRVKQEAEDVTNQRMRTLCEEHERQVAELQRLLNNESERLTLAREEICDLSMSKGKDVMEMKSKLEAAQRSSADFREETKLKLERIVADFASKEKEYHELIGSLKIQIDLEKQNCRKSTEEITGKARSYETQCRRFEEKTTALHHECERLTQTLDATQKHIAHLNQQNVEAVEMLRQAQHENGIMRQEMMLTETDRKRLRQENTELRSQVEKYDKMFYGKSRATQ